MAFDFDRFRLRRFLERLHAMGEVEVHEKPVALCELAAIIEATSKTTWFKSVGPEKFEMCAGIASNRKRLAAAFGVGERELLGEFMRRLATPQKVAEIASKDAPVHQLVLTGDQVDLTKLPFYLQHEFDGAPYISSAMDFTVDAATKKNNVGFRRLMLVGKTEMRSNLTQASDLKKIYAAAVERKEKLPVSFVIGSHPLDFVGAAARFPGDEFEMLARLRGSTLPMVKGVTNGVPVPADAELVIEGYFDHRGWAETEGPYGELYGFYGPMHPDPLFTATAITMRKDALHHTLLHGGRVLSRNDAAYISALSMESLIWRTLKDAGLDVKDVYLPPAAVGLHHLRVAIKQTAEGQGRATLTALMKLPLIKHIFVVNDDIDIHNDEDMEWALCTRFRADQDFVTESGHFTMSMDPTGIDGKMIKAGFDCTLPFGLPDTIDRRQSYAPHMKAAVKTSASVEEALTSGPKYFVELMEALGSLDGREIAAQLGDLERKKIASRLPDTRWTLTA